MIDVPVGPTAKIRSSAAAIQLRKLFEYVGAQLALPLEVMLTDGSAPNGRGVRPAQEARDQQQVQNNAAEAPSDLRERALALAGRILEFDPALPGGAGVKRARELLESGAALAKMERIVAAQGPPPESPALGRLTREVVSEVDGAVTAIDCGRIARLARLAGAPTAKGAGIDLLKKPGDRVERGESLYRIHACMAVDFRMASEEAAEDDGFRVFAASEGGRGR